MLFSGIKEENASESVLNSLTSNGVETNPSVVLEESLNSKQDGDEEAINEVLTF